MFTKPYCFGKLDLSNQSKSAGRASSPLGCNIGQPTAKRGPLIQKSHSLILSFPSAVWVEPSWAYWFAGKPGLIKTFSSFHVSPPIHLICSPRLHWCLLEVKLVGTFKEKNMREFLKFKYLLFSFYVKFDTCLSNLACIVFIAGSNPWKGRT